MSEVPEPTNPVRNSISDPERLTEALEYGVVALRKHMDEALRVRTEAARAYRDLLANGERVEWCVEHDMAFDGPNAGVCLAVFYMPLEDAAITAECARTERWVLSPTIEEET